MDRSRELVERDEFTKVENELMVDGHRHFVDYDVVNVNARFRLIRCIAHFARIRKRNIE